MEKSPILTFTCPDFYPQTTNKISLIKIFNKISFVFQPEDQLALVITNLEELLNNTNPIMVQDIEDVFTQVYCTIISLYASSDR